MQRQSQPRRAPWCPAQACPVMLLILSSCKVLGLSFSSAAFAQAFVASFSMAAMPRASSQREPRLPHRSVQKTAAMEGLVVQPNRRGIPGAVVTLRHAATSNTFQAATSGDGIFRMSDLPPGRYELRIEAQGFERLARSNLALEASEILQVEFTLHPVAEPTRAEPRLVHQIPFGAASVPPESPPKALPPFRKILRRPSEPSATAILPAEAPRVEQLYVPESDRWRIPMPEWSRYGRKAENSYVQGHWWNPYNRNKLKGDYPIFGKQTFLDFTAVSDTFFDGRRVPAPSNVSAARPGSSSFFGRGEQAALSQDFRFTLDLSHGDTSFKPVDWRLRVTPEFNLNYLATRELGIVNIDVRRGTGHFDHRVGLQEAFFEYKAVDLNPNYDFLSVRAGIQGFTSDFRGFLFADEQPGLRVFGNLRANRWQYNLAYFNMLEKDTNSRLNTFDLRRQQVVVGNLYMQDFIWPGYTTELSVHLNKDEPTMRFDGNGFLVRPAPIGSVRPHRIEVAYLGWAGNGHIHRINVNHAFYQALGEESLNPLAGRRTTVNAQMAAVEVSVDKDWARIRGSFLYASGDSNPRDGRARGFDAIQDLPAFAGGVFSLWNREGIRLTGTGVSLTPADSLLPSLRTSHDGGQANFVNPGIFIYNAGADFDVTPKLRAVLNANYLRFARTEPLELLLFQSPIHHSIGLDYGMGFVYRPPLSENIVLTAGASALTPGRGFEDIYTKKTLFSLFANLRLRF